MIVGIGGIAAGTCLAAGHSVSAPPSVLHCSFHSLPASLSCQWPHPFYSIPRANRVWAPAEVQTPQQPPGSFSVLTSNIFIPIVFGLKLSDSNSTLPHTSHRKKKKLSKVQLSHPQNGPSIIGLIVRIKGNNTFKELGIVLGTYYHFR